MKVLTETKKINISEGLDWHITNKTPLHENVYRFGSNNYFKLINEVRKLYNSNLIKLDNKLDEWLVSKTDIGRVGKYDGKFVMLDIPISVNEADEKKNVALNKPSRNSGSGKKYKVYVKNDKGNVIKVTFGDTKGGLTAKINNPEARKAFADRHNCSEKKDKTKPGYWACNMPRYWKSLGGSKNLNTYW